MRVYIVMVLLVGLFIGCGKKLPKSVKDKEEIKKELSKESVTVKEGESLALAVKNPDLFSGYDIKTYEYLDQKSLFKKINGAADGYIVNHGFVGCGYVELRHKLNDIPIVLFVYDMRRAINAFGIYSSELNPRANFVDVGTGGYLDERSIIFWKNRYYIKVELQGDSDKAKDIMMSLARSISKMVPSDLGGFKNFDLFPKENRLRNGERFYYGNFASQSYFRDVYEVKYNVSKGESPDRVFLTFVKDGKEAKGILKRYKDFLRSGLTGIRNINNGFYAVDKLDDKPILLVTGGNYLIGIWGFANLEKQKEVLNSIVKKVN